MWALYFSGFHQQSISFQTFKEDSELETLHWLSIGPSWFKTLTHLMVLQINGKQITPIYFNICFKIN